MQIITLTTDFGDEDNYVAVVKGVILGIYPYAKIIDITHNITPQNIWQANWTLGSSFLFFPKDTIHLSIVDPGVGSDRLPILIRTENYFFVGPNNGVFSFLDKSEKIVDVINLTEKKYHLKNVSYTFHARDIFAPVSAHLAKGVKYSDFGSSIKKDELIKLPEIVLNKKNKNFIGIVQHIDHFGNLITNIPNHSIPENSNGKIKGKGFKKIFKSYASGKNNEVIAVYGSHGYIEICSNLGNAFKLTNAFVGDKVEIKTP